MSIHRVEYSLMRKSAVDENSHLHNIKYRIKRAAAAGCSLAC